MEKQNKFKIVIPSYNNEQWVEPNVASILDQTYTNYEVLYINDASTDNTESIVKNIIKDYSLEKKWKLITNKENKKRGYNVSPHNKNIIDFINNDEDILVFVDGDDWLIDKNVLLNLNSYYNNKEVWMTYGGMYCYPTGEIANPQNTPYSKEIHHHNAYRRDHWRASHLRTFKWHLYKKILKEDMLYSKTKKYYFHAEDLATSYPCLEMCPEQKIGVVDFPTYMFNATPSNRERGIQRENDAGMDLELEIRNQSPYKQIRYIIPTLSGGLCNMMFQLASAYSIGKENSLDLVSTFIHHGTLHNHPNNYKNNIFRKISTLNKNTEGIKIKENRFEYNKIEINNKNNNIILEGYFQSYKYFDKYKKDIITLFEPTNEDKNYIDKKYGTILKKDTLSLHIRRSNYTQLSNYHTNLNEDYYTKALDYFTDKHLLIFSDDIDWCKQKFTQKNITFMENNPDYIDLYIMSMCKDNIIANSTFSWWAAWLNTNKNKKVIAPNNWFGPSLTHSINDLLPENWIKI